MQGAPCPSPVAPDYWGARFRGPGLCSAPPPARRRAAGGRVAAGKQAGGVAAAGQGEPPAPLTWAAAGFPLGLCPRGSGAGGCSRSHPVRPLSPLAGGTGGAPLAGRAALLLLGVGAGSEADQSASRASLQSPAPPLPAEQLNRLWLPPGDQEPPAAPAAASPVLGGGLQPSGSGAHSSSTSPQLRYHVPVRITCYNKPTSPN